ncbi:hypothetical protein E3226_008585 [Legionella geestiana]|uniref:hypothetical protein n=1 Tax=Legionella geestiana TaxID=45065 RepID=UPI0010923D8E|nr:hypothetical protein [Legionella geestiana]QDQ40438.1 hypothetical protein E3226_008585 [Legionella geestiana]
MHKIAIRIRGNVLDINRDEVNEYWQLARRLEHAFGINARSIINFYKAYSSEPITGALPKNLSGELRAGIVSYISSTDSDFLAVTPPKKFDLSLTYEQKSSESTYSHEPRGSLSVARLIAGKPCFVAPHPRSQIKKQRILFHDWSAAGWSVNRATQVTRLASQLLKEGYSLFVFHENTIQPVTSGKTLVMRLRENCRVLTEETLYRAAAKIKIPRDELHILDYHGLNAIIDGSASIQKTLETGDWWHNLESDKRQALVSDLQNTHLPFEAIICNTFPDDISMAKVLQQSLHLPIVWRFGTVNLDAGLLDELIHAQTATRDGIALNRSHFEQVTSLTLHPCGKRFLLPQGAGRVLQSFTALKSLSLEHADGTFHLRGEITFPHLETLSVSGSDIDNETLEELLRKTPNLKHLALEGCNAIKWESLDYSLFANLESLNMDGHNSLNDLLESAQKLKTINLSLGNPYKTLTQAPVNLRQVENLSLNGGPIHGKDLEHILAYAERLSCLTFVDAPIAGYLLSNLPLPSLECLVFESFSTNSRYEFKAISSLLMNSPKLKVLDLGGAKFGTSRVLMSGSLPALETLKLCHSPITSASLQGLLHNAKNLKYLDVSFCENITEDFSCSELPALKTLKLGFTTISSQSLQGLLHNARNLKDLDASGCKNITADFSCLELAALVKLNLQISSITSQSLQGLLHNARNLKDLDACGCNNITADFSCGELPSLEALKLQGSSITSQSLQGLLHNARNLKELNASYCKNITEHFSCGELAALETLELRGLSITSQSLQGLLHNARNLKYLDVSSCKNITADFSCGELAALEALELSGSSITSQSLQGLLHNARNLKELNASYCKNITEHFSCCELAALEALKLSESFITSQSLQGLLHNARNLKYLDVSRCYNITEDFSCPELAALETLKLYNLSITSQSLQGLLHNAKNLKELDVSGCKSISVDFSCGELAALERLKLSESSITSQSLQGLLHNARNLKYLDVSDCKSISVDFSCNKLAALKKLNLRASTITSQSLQGLLHNAKNLKELDAYGCKNITADFSCNKLAALERLNLRVSTITSQSLQGLLRNAKNLKELDASGCNNITADFSCNKLAALETLNLRISTITSQSLQGLLHNAQNLKNLDISYCRNISADFSCGELTALTRLEAEYSALSPEALANLLRQAPNLTRVNLSGNPQFEQDKLSAELRQLLAQVKDVVYPVPQKADNPHLPAFAHKPDSQSALLSSEAASSSVALNQLLSGLTNAPKTQYGTDTGASRPESTGNMTASLATQPIQPPAPETPSTQAPAPTPSECRLDADTTNPNTPQRAKRIFYPLANGLQAPLVNRYRLQTFDALHINREPCGLSDAFRLALEGEPDYLEVDYERLPTVEAIEGPRTHASPIPFYLGIQELAAGKHWQPLASLSPRETLSHLHTEPADADISLAYSKRDNQYYLRVRSEVPSLTVRFVVQEHAPEPAPLVPEAIHALQQELMEYGEGALEGVQPEWSGSDYLQAIRTQKKGACRHRAVAFKAAMEERFPAIPVRIVVNDVHAFAEVCIDGYWLTLDFGGYQARLQIDDSHRPAGDDVHEDRAVFEEANLEPSGALIPVSPSVSNARLFERALETWKKKSARTPSLSAWCQQKVACGAPLKQLIELPSDTALQGLHYALERHCRHISRPVFYVHTPDDLVCQAPFVRMADNGREGIPCRGPGGPLYDFLTQPYTRDNPPVLIVNYSRFKADDLVRFNALLDDTRLADGVPVPKEAIIVGLVNTRQPGRYTGSDFYSRFALQVETCPFAESLLARALPETHTEEIPPDADVTTLDVFHAADWKERLLGRWILQGSALFFEEGELVRALKEGRQTVVIANGLWENPEFLHVFREACAQRMLTYSGGSLPFPEGLRFYRQEGYDWETLVSNVTTSHGLHARAVVCNPLQLSQFFRRYACRDAALYTLPGLFEAHQGQTLHVNVTAALSDDAWAECLSVAKRFNTALHLHVAPGVTLPAFLPEPLAAAASSDSPMDLTPPLPPEWQASATAHTMAVVSDDPDTTIARLTRHTPGVWKVLDVSEWSAGDLTASLRGSFDADSLGFSFSEKRSAFNRALDAGESILLTGQLTPDIIDALAVVFLERQQSAPAGRLMVVTDNRDALSFAEPLRHTVRAEEKAALLGLCEGELERIGGTADLAAEPLSVLQTRLTFIRQHPGAPFANAWEGLESLPAGFHLPPFNPETSAAEAAAFNAARLAQVNAVLQEAPFIFLTGLTGVGKTTFVNKYLAREATVYQGENALVSALNDPREGRKIIYVTEANLHLRQWSECEGLFHTPPTLPVNGELVTIPDSIRFVFDGNPVSYGDDRSLATFFVRHGNARRFDPLPPACLYEEVLKPVFADTPLQEQAATLCQPLLDAYRFIGENADDEVLITPRELQMMALLLITAGPLFPDCSLEARARYHAWDIARHALPDGLRARFDARFTPESLPQAKVPPACGNYLVTPSRAPLITALDQLMALKAARHALDTQDEAEAATPEKMAKLYGGLGGLIVEGEPGIGKSELIFQYLQHNGFRRRGINDSSPGDARSYCVIPVSMSLEERTQALLKAFHEGTIVIMDEVNSSPMLEKLCNGLLMGFGPDGERPENPGFLLLGTQNPITMAGRQAQSTALSRRMLTITLPSYSGAEMGFILRNAIGIPEEVADDMVQAYEKQRTHAQTRQLTPMPCFRDLLNLAEQYAGVHQIAKPVLADEELSRLRDALAHPPAVAASSVAPASVTPASVTPASVTPASVTPASVTPASVAPASAAPASAAPASAAAAARGGAADRHAREAVKASARRIVTAHYQPSAWNEWRGEKNWLAVAYTDLKPGVYRDQCMNFFGVDLKRKILEIAVTELLEAQGDRKKIGETLDALCDSGALAILEKGQGFTSRMFPCIKTSAAKSLKSILDEISNPLKSMERKP